MWKRWLGPEPRKGLDASFDRQSILRPLVVHCEQHTVKTRGTEAPRTKAPSARRHKKDRHTLPEGFPRPGYPIILVQAAKHVAFLPSLDRAPWGGVEPPRGRLVRARAALETSGRPP